MPASYGPSSHESDRRSGSTFVLVIGGLLVGAGLLVFLTSITAGFFLWFIWITLLIGAFSLVHYLLWGRMLERETTQERKELEAEDERRSTIHLPWEKRF